MNKKFYFKILLKSIPRVLSLVDQKEISATSGCFDRNYWKYKTKFFPDATFQQLVLPLTVIWQYKNKENIYYKNENILKIIKQSILFWTKIQNQKGYFNEWYKGERSYVATSFTTYAITESFIAIKEHFDRQEKEIIYNAFRKAGDWLMKNNDLIVANHTAGAIPALYNLYLIFDKNKYKKEAKNKLNILFSLQNTEGWLLEYGGADAGYLNVSLCYLARYFFKSNDKDIFPYIKKILKFLVYMINPDGSFAGEYGVRDIKYFLPSGIQLFANYFKEAYFILKKWYKSLVYNILPECVDDKYFAFFILPDFTDAFVYSHKKEFKTGFQLPQNYTKFFSNSGIFIYKRDKFYLITNLKKATPFKIFYKNRLIYSENSICVNIKNKIFITCYLDSRQKIKISKNKIILKRRFIKYKEIKWNMILYLFFNVINSFLSKSEIIGNLISNYLKYIAILKNRYSNIILEREIIFKKEETKIKDKIIAPKIIESLWLEPEGTFKHIPSSEYFVLNTLFSIRKRYNIQQKEFFVERIFKKDYFNISIKNETKEKIKEFSI